MYARAIFLVILVFLFATEATAQNRLRWRPGMILEGLADTVQTVARDIGDQETSVPPAEGTPVDAQGLAPHPTQHHHHPGHGHHPAAHPKPARPPATGHPVRTPAGPPSQRAALAASIDDVIKMVKLGLGETTIVKYVGDNGMKQHLGVSDLIRLHEEGVSEPIVNAMQNARVVYADTNPEPIVPPATNHSFRSESDSVRTPAEAALEKQFGPSILAPQQHPILESPATSSESVL